MLRTTVTGAIVAGCLLGAGVATAQMGAPSGASTADAIIPVTGPSVGPAPEVVPAMIPDKTGGEMSPQAGTGRPTAVAHAAPNAVKAAHAPGTKSIVKKTSATTKPVGKATGTAKAKHVAQAKHKAPAHHAMARKPAATAKRHSAPPPGKEGAPSQPVLPRV